MPSIRRLVVSPVAIAGLCLASGCAVAIPEEPTNVTTTGATLNARVSTSFGGPVTYWFGYGQTAAYGAETTHRTIDLAQGAEQPVSEPITGLSANTQYHWQVCAQDDEEDPPRVVCSSDQTFEGRNVSCGQTITRSIYVTNDLQNCASSGLTIGANDITLNLNGHTIDGELTGQGSVTGIRNLGFDEVTIKNGIVQEFGVTGVTLADAAGNHVRGLDVHSALQQGIDVSGDSTDTLIEDNEVSAIGIALRLNSSDLQINVNVVSGLGATSSNKLGPLVVFGDDNLIEGNTARLEHIDGIGTGVGRGSLLVFGDRNQILGNTASDSVLNGIVVDVQAADTLLSGNLAENNGHEFSFGDGILVESASTSLADNIANLNADLGINAVAGATDLGGNQAQGNGDPAQCQNVACQ